MIQRKFIIGSEWLYYKIYTGPSTAENILVDIYSDINKMIRNSLIDCFFFIRYQDPDYHIRIRLHVTKTDKLSDVCQIMCSCLEGYVKHYIVHKVEIDTYSREIERYGLRDICNCEHLFYKDSDFIIKFLKGIKCENNERWLISMGFMYNIMEAIGFSIDDMIKFTNKMADGYYYEMYGQDKIPSKNLNKLYRDKRIDITTLFNMRDKLKWWIEQRKYIMTEVQSYKNGISEEVIGSLIHMHFNRMFRTRQRLIEMVIYYYLHKFLVSEKARGCLLFT